MEPNGLIVKALKKNLELNGLENNGVVIEAALSNKMGETPLFSSRDRPLETSMSRNKGYLRRVGSVPTVTMDYLIESQGFRPPRVVKIDVEGAEGLVVAGASRLLNSENKPSHIFLELHPDYMDSFGYSAEDVVGSLLDVGYKRVSGDDCARGDQTLCHFTTDGR